MNNQPIIDTTSKQDEYIEILKKHFPSVINQLDDGSYTIDKEQLQLMLEPKNCKIIEDGYGLKWVGKKEAYHNAYIHNNKILKPLVDDSKHFDTTSNILIKGDNLDALKLLKKNYFEKIKMIYIDPPYNTQSDGFIYNDNFTKSQEDVLEELGYSEDQKEYIKNIAGAKTHSGWLSFMYPRLLLARDLLKDDGVIFISIDDNEQANLKLLCDEVFGAENFVGEFIINSTPNGMDYGNIAKQHEFVLFYAKQIEITKTNLIPKKDIVFRFQDNIGGFNIHPLYNSNEAFHKNNRPNLYYPFYLDPEKITNDGFYEIMLVKSANLIEIYPPHSQRNGVQFVWRWGQALAALHLNIEIVGYKTNDGEYRIVQKMRHSTKLIRSLLLDTEVSSRKGTAEVEALFNNKIFSHPKPIALLNKLIFISTDIITDDTILDFFAGSGTTADAVMQLNAEDGGNRKFVLAQIDEECNDKTAIGKNAIKFLKAINKPTNIFEITAERLRRAGQKILKDNNESKEPKDLSSLDIGFKVYEVADDQYNSIYDKKFNDVSQAELALIKSDDIVKADSLTILTNLLLGSGIALDTKIDVLLADSLYRVDDKLFILKEFDLQPELFNGVEYATIYARYFTNDSFIANLTSFIDKDKIIVKG